MPTQEIKVKFEFVYANGRRQKMEGSIDRTNFDLDEVERLYLHIQPAGTKIENMRAVDAKGRDLPRDEQPIQFRPKDEDPTVVGPTSPRSPVSTASVPLSASEPE